jgi:hypothetical protein
MTKYISVVSINDENSEAEVDEIIAQLEMEKYSVLRSGPSRLEIWETELI